MRASQRRYKANEDDMIYTGQCSAGDHLSIKIFLLFSLALDKTYVVFKISFATMLHTKGTDMGSEIFHFVVFFYEKLGQNYKSILISRTKLYLIKILQKMKLIE
jgi:hypothetical protein